MSMRINTTLILFFLTTTLVFAQEGWEDGDIESAEVIIEKDKKIELPRANRNYEKIAPLPVQTNNEIGGYQYKNFVLPFNPVSPSIRVLKVKDPALEKLYSNYVKLGFGNYLTPYLEGYLANKRNPNYSYGLNFSHFSSARGPVEKNNSGSGTTNIELYGKNFGEKATVSGELNYNLRTTHFYGYRVLEGVDYEAVKQAFNHVELNTSIAGTNTKKFGYNLSASLGLLSDKFEASESILGVGLKSHFNLSDESSILLDAEVSSMSRKDSSKISRNLVKIQPQYKFVYNDFQIQAGVNIVFENDTVPKADKVHIYPLARASYDLSPVIKIYAGIRGDIMRNSLSSLVIENPWIKPNAELINTQKNFEFFGGIKGRISASTIYELGISAADYRYMQFFANNSVDTTQFDVVYDRGNTLVNSFYGEISHIKSDKMRFTARLDLNDYSTENIIEAWHRPSSQITLLGYYNLYDKILFNAEFFILGGLKARSPSDQSIVKLDGIADFNFKAEYLISNRGSFFVRLDNVFSSKYERYLNYPSRGFMAIAGLSFSF